MSLLVGLILTALNGPVGTESRGVAVFANFDIASLKDLESTFILTTNLKLHNPTDITIHVRQIDMNPNGHAA